jgi:hypothetical protein
MVVEKYKNNYKDVTLLGCGEIYSESDVSIQFIFGNLPPRKSKNTAKIMELLFFGI